jgi:hypothetical protein
MDITHDFDRWAELDERGLREEDLARGLADGRDLSVLEAKRLGDFAGVADVQKPLDHVIHIE